MGNHQNPTIVNFLYALATLAAIVILVDIGIATWYMLSEGISAKTLFFSGKQVDLLSGVANTLIPTVAAFIAIITPAAGYFQKHKTELSAQSVKVSSIASVFVIAIVSLGLLILLQTLMVNCARPFDQLTEHPSQYNIYWLNLFYFAGVRLAELAILVFFAAVDLAAVLALKVLYNVGK